MKKFLIIILAVTGHLTTFSQFGTTLDAGDRGNYGDRPGSIGRDAGPRDAGPGKDEKGNVNLSIINPQNRAKQNENSLSSMFGTTPLTTSLANNSKVSHITRDAIVAIQNDIILLKQTKGILIGSQLVILFQNPAEILGSLFLAIKFDDWKATMGAMKDINILQKQAIEQHILNTLYELETSPPFPGKSQEKEFWTKFEESIK